MGREIDIAALVAGLASMQQKSSLRDAITVVQAMCTLRRTKLPEAYLDGMESELLQMIGRPFPDCQIVKVYLAFHGPEDRATHMKIGVARDVDSRMATLSTGNPLPLLWRHEAPFSSRAKAMRVERLLLAHMGADRVKGEWVKVAGLSSDAAQAVAESLAEVASANVSAPVTFSRLGA